MPQYSGRTLLLKVGDGASPEVFSNLCGLTTRSFTIGNEEVDTTTPNCITPANKLNYDAVYGTQQITFSGSGKYTDDTQVDTLVNAARLQSALNMQVVWPGYGTFEGAVLVTNYEVSGEMTGNADFSADFTFVGTVSFTSV